MVVIKGEIMSDLTVIQNNFKKEIPAVKHFRDLAIDAEKFPDKYQHIFMLAINKDLIGTTIYPDSIPLLLQAGALQMIEDILNKSDNDLEF
jgi:hypothetical protein